MNKLFQLKNKKKGEEEKGKKEEEQGKKEEEKGKKEEEKKKKAVTIVDDENEEKNKQTKSYHNKKQEESDFNFDEYLEIIKRKNKTLEEINNDITQILDPCYPSNLNSLIMIGICYMNQKIVDYENILCESSSKLTRRPNFNFNIENNDIKNIIIDSPYAYDINEVVRILEHKFSKYIFLCSHSTNEGDRDSYYSDSMLFFPKDGILPHYNYLILPYNYTQNKFNEQNIQAFIETFQYCYKIGIMRTKNITEESINFLKKYTMKYQLRWIITIHSNSKNETSCPLLNSCLYIKREENKPFYLKISNNSISEVTEDDILSTFISYSSGKSRSKDKKGGAWMPLYFCYEKVPLSNEERAKHDQIVNDYLNNKKGD